VGEQAYVEGDAGVAQAEHVKQINALAAPKKSSLRTAKSAL
jgi:hypothetical protein